VTDVTLPTILYQFKGAPDQASMITNIGSGAPNYNGIAVAGSSLPLSDTDRGAIFRGANSTNTIWDGIGTAYPATNTGTFYYFYGNQRLVSDYDGTPTPYQRTGIYTALRTYLAHYFVTPRTVFGSGGSAYVDSWYSRGSLGLSPGKAYVNGVLRNGAMSTTWDTQTIMFGGTYLSGSWQGWNYFCCDVPIFAWWASPISDGEMALWETAVLERLEL